MDLSTRISLYLNFFFSICFRSKHTNHLKHHYLWRNLTWYEKKKSQKGYMGMNLICKKSSIYWSGILSSRLYLHLVSMRRLFNSLSQLFEPVFFLMGPRAGKPISSPHEVSGKVTLYHLTCSSFVWKFFSLQIFSSTRAK